MRSSITWKIGGEAGFGIMSSGTMFAKTFSRHGYHILATNEYPSLIRGGHNLVTVRVSSEEFYSLDKDVHILAALNKETIDLHKDELVEQGVVLFDPQDYDWKDEHFSKPVKLIPIGLKEMVRQKNADPVMRNTILLGATLAVMGTDVEWLKEIISNQFQKKGEQVIKYNEELALLGYDHVHTVLGGSDEYHIEKREKSEEQLVINASEAVALGAIKAGMKFAAIYPMTPINSVISFLADHAKQLGIVYRQPEDEIAGMNMALGASYAGVRSMVATSGGGFALMTEALSLSGIMELPIVIDLGMRAGPATGMPTWTESGELQFAIHAGHGEFPRVVLAPGNCEQAFVCTAKAFNIADKFQIPVFVLTDKYMNESQWVVKQSVFDQSIPIERGKLLSQDDLQEGKEYKRYHLETDDGVSPRSLPGMKYGQYFSNGYEHDEQGIVTEEEDLRIHMVEKRLKKFPAIQKDIWEPHVYGDNMADMTFVTWGSTTGPVLEAMGRMKKQGASVRVIQYVWMFPFPTEKTKELLEQKSRYVIVEQNATAQLASLIMEHTGIAITEKLLKYSGRPFYPEEIIEFVRK
jgi:2-oxoglutarate ferredoxin oxidoreductase subunit alpha